MLKPIRNDFLFMAKFYSSSCCASKNISKLRSSFILLCVAKLRRSQNFDLSNVDRITKVWAASSMSKHFDVWNSQPDLPLAFLLCSRAMPCSDKDCLKLLMKSEKNFSSRCQGQASKRFTERLSLRVPDVKQNRVTFKTFAAVSSLSIVKQIML